MYVSFDLQYGWLLRSRSILPWHTRKNPIFAHVAFLIRLLKFQHYGILERPQRRNNTAHVFFTEFGRSLFGWKIQQLVTTATWYRDCHHTGFRLFFHDLQTLHLRRAMSWSLTPVRTSDLTYKIILYGSQKGGELVPKFFPPYSRHF